MNRQEYNRQILKLFEIMVENHPDLRFQQILYMFGLENNVSCYYDESDYTHEHIVASVKRIADEDLKRTIMALLAHTS